MPISDLGGNYAGNSLLSMILAGGSFQMLFMKVTFYSYLSESLCHEYILDFVQCVFCLNWHNFSSLAYWYSRLHKLIFKWVTDLV